MKRKKLLPLAAAALACGVLIAAPQAASALAPDQAAPEVLGQANDYYYYEGDGYISYDDTYGYIRLDQDELYLTIQPGSSSTSQYLKVLYVEDQSSRITWTSSNASVATVDGNGCVTGWSQGTAIITARSAGGSVGSCIVYVDEASQLNTSVLSMEIEYNNPQPRSQLYLKSRNGYDMCSSGAAPTLPLSPLTATATSPHIRRAPPPSMPPPTAAARCPARSRSRTTSAA